MEDIILFAVGQKNGEPFVEKHAINETMFHDEYGGAETAVELDIRSIYENRELSVILLSYEELIAMNLELTNTLMNALV